MKKPDNGRVTDAVMTRSIISSVLGILLCMVCLFGTTWAWYTSSVESGENVTVGGNLEFRISSGESELVPNGQGEYEFTGEQTVTVRRTGTATKAAFCQIQAKTGGEEPASTYYIVGLSSEGTLSFTVSGVGTLKLTPMWGKPTDGCTKITAETTIRLAEAPANAKFDQEEEEIEESSEPEDELDDESTQPTDGEPKPTGDPEPGT